MLIGEIDIEAFS